MDDELLLSFDGSYMITKVSGKFHFDGTTTGDDGVSSDGSGHDHDGIIEGAGCLFDVLGGTSSDDESDSLCVGARGEHVVSLITELDLFELTAGSKNTRGDSIGRSLNYSTSGLADSV